MMSSTLRPENIRIVSASAVTHLFEEDLRYPIPEDVLWKAPFRAAADLVFREGWFQRHERKTDIHIERIVRIPVLDPVALTTFEDRVAEKSLDIAAKVARRAKFEVANWGSYYGHGSIQKAEALRFINEAFLQVTGRDLSAIPEDTP